MADETVTIDMSACPCCTPLACCGCVATSRRWQFTLTGVTNNGCSECAAYNRDWFLFYDGGATCTWSTMDGSPCQEGSPPPPIEVANTADLACGFDGVNWFWTLTIWGTIGGSALHTAKYEGTVTNCLGDNILSQVASPHAPCTNFPATVTLSPA